MMYDGLLTKRLSWTAMLIVVCLLAPAAVSAKGPLDKVPGYVDGQPFIDIAGEEAMTLEFSLHGSLLKGIMNINADLSELAGGLESIHAVILEFGSGPVAAKMKKLVFETEKNLEKKGWEQLLRVHEDNEEVRILVLSDEETVQGLVVMVVDGTDGELVFANIAGAVNLSAIAAIGEQLNVPGLDQLKGQDD